MRAVSDAAAELGASKSSQRADLDTVATRGGSVMRFKRKSGREKRGQRASEFSWIAAAREGLPHDLLDSSENRFVGRKGGSLGHATTFATPMPRPVPTFFGDEVDHQAIDKAIETVPFGGAMTAVYSWKTML